ncbi:MAG TPA: DUF3137 domain-containing protein, partial [Candidatus Saccharimonadales bacterium]|nr:DUF3137 domain-containing protein [Candidatus Saccharimonadales bacterium]
MFALGQLAAWLDFARAGGGGSSSGDGGSIIALVGYLPMHFIGAKLRKLGFNHEIWIIFQVIGWIIGIAYALVLTWFLGGLGFLMAIGAILGTGAGLYNWFSLLKRSKKVTQALKSAAQQDAAWNETDIVARAKQVFYQYQADWSARNWQNMAGYMTPEYNRHSSLMVAALLQAHRLNLVDKPTINQMTVVNLHDSTVNSEDVVTVGLTAKADDRLVDDRDGKQLFRDASAFTEFWQFKRSGNDWILDGIQQATAAGWRHNAKLEAFARQNGYFYSLDWGWLLLPRRGRLFGKSKFGTSDINNHVIGIYNQAYLLQLYTYDPNPNNAGSYLIAQTNLPKSYGDIVVRRKKWHNWLAPRGLKQVSMEWGDFNKKYQVYASDVEQVTSFELLHPAFMERLEALPFEVNIEIVDNVAYL